MDRFLNELVLYTSVAWPVSCAIWAWRSWIRTEKSSIRRWRRASSILRLGLVSAGICLGAFSSGYIYWRPEPGPGLPTRTIITMEIGAIAALLAALFAKSWTRLALASSSLGLLWFLFLIALSP